MMRKIFLVTIVLMLSGTLCLFAAGSDDTGTAAGRVMPTAPGTFPVVEEKVTLKMFAPQYATVENMETNLLTVEYEEKTNVHIEWQLAPEQGFAEKRNLVLASGNYPDAFIASSIPASDQMLYGEQGVFIAHNDLIDNYTIHVKKIIETIPDLKSVITAPDGNIYALGTDGMCYHCSFQQKYWVYKPWLDKLGLEMPRTTDEYYDTLVAFKTQDPNGNGEADEIPLAGAINGWNMQVVPFLMNAFVYDDGGDHLTIENGVIDLAFTQPAWRAGLSYVKKLYDEELLDPTSFTITANQVKQIANHEGDVILGSVPGGAQGAFIGWTNERWKDYHVIPPLKGPAGVQTTRYASTAAPGRFAITSAAELPEVAIRWVDWFYSTEGGLRSRIGREGYEWAKGEPGDIGLNGKPAVWKKLTPIGTAQNFFWGQGNWPQQFTHSEQARSGIEGQLYDFSKLYEVYKPDEYVLPLWVGSEDIQEYSQLRTDINDYVAETIARFITGDLSLDADWDSYIKALENIGTQRYVDIINKWYSAKYGS